MISKSNYFAITLIVCIVLIMFQMTGVSESVLMSSGENIYGEEAADEGTAQAEKRQYNSSVRKLTEGEAFVGLVGDPQSACLSVGQEWCINQKRTYCRYTDLSAAAADAGGARFLLTDGTALGAQDAQALKTLAEQGRYVVVSGLPDLEAMENPQELLSALGIRLVAEESLEIDGWKLFSGLVLGGEIVYEDYPQEIVWPVLMDSVTAYGVAQSEEERISELENEELPAVIWRYAPAAGKVYVVNGDYLNGHMGAGLLTGFAADCQRVDVYPVVNAQVSVVSNYPVLADENKETVQRIYGQRTTLLFRDILWPSIVAIYYDTKDAMTVTAAPRLDYTRGGGEVDSEDRSLATYYYEQITKEQGEIGLSADQVSDIPLSEKMEQDMEYFQEVLPSYEFHTFAVSDTPEEEYRSLLGKGSLLEDVRTVLYDYQEDSGENLFSYLKEEVLKLPLYMDSTQMEAEDDFRSRCIQTAYGWYGAKTDAARVVYPETEEDSWNRISNEWSRFYRPYRVPFEVFDKLTAVEADRRVRNYMALSYETAVSGTEVRVSVESHDGDGYFILRTHGEEVEKISGGSCEEIEPGWYLLSIPRGEAVITLKQSDSSRYEMR